MTGTRSLPRLLLPILCGALAAQDGAELQGLVVDVLDAAVPAARIVLRRADTGTVLAMTSSDAEGIWKLARVPNGGVLELAIAAPGKVERRLQVGSESSPLCIVLDDGEALAGVVTADGAPVAGAWVVAQRQAGYSVLAWFVRSDAQGRYRFDALPFGLLRVLAFDAGRIVAEQTAQIAAHQVTRLDFAIYGERIEPRELRVRGLAADARATAGFAVKCAVPLPPELAFVPVGDGDSVRYPSLPWPHIVQLRAAGCEGEPGSVRVQAFAAAAIEIAAVPAASRSAAVAWRGRLTDAEGAPIRGVEVSCCDRLGIELAHAPTGTDGTFALSVAARSGALLNIHVVGVALQGKGDFTFEPAHELKLVGELVARLHGRLRDARGGAIAFGGVWLESKELSSGGCTDREGRIDWSELPSGSYEVRVFTADGAVGKASVTLAAGTATEIPALQFEPSCEICGRVLDAAGAPVAGASVAVQEREPVRCDRDGRFRIRCVSPGRHTLAAWPPGQLWERADGSERIRVTVEPGGVTTTDITLPRQR